MSFYRKITRDRSLASLDEFKTDDRDLKKSIGRLTRPPREARWNSAFQIQEDYIPEKRPDYESRPRARFLSPIRSRGTRGSSSRVSRSPVSSSGSRDSRSRSSSDARDRSRSPARSTSSRDSRCSRDSRSSRDYRNERKSTRERSESPAPRRSRRSKRSSSRSVSRSRSPPKRTSPRDRNLADRDWDSPMSLSGGTPVNRVQSRLRQDDLADFRLDDWDDEVKESSPSLSGSSTRSKSKYRTLTISKRPRSRSFS